MGNARCLAIVIVMFNFVGCRQTSAPAPTNPYADSHERYHLSFFDDNNQLIAAGTIDLPRDWPSIGHRFQGHWQLKSASSNFPTDATRDGIYSGYVDSPSVSTIDLNPGVADHNVILSGDLAHYAPQGDWIETNVGGGKPMGKFSLSR